MHEKERHKIILAEIQERPVVTVPELVELTSASEATVRRDIAALHMQNRLRRVRGGCEALHPPAVRGLAGRPYSVNESIHSTEKRAIAREAVALCEEGDAIIINGGTTTFQMVPLLTHSRLEIFTNSLPIADYLLKHSKNTITLSGGTVYREQNIVLNPFDNDIARHFCARRMFMGASGIGPMGVMESDPLVLHAEITLMRQADELVMLVDSSKFRRRSSRIVCALDQVHTVITDERIDDADAAMLEATGVQLVVASSQAQAQQEAQSGTARAAR